MSLRKASKDRVGRDMKGSMASSRHHGPTGGKETGKRARYSRKGKRG